ncbi:hypothetical protein A2V68_00840 [candidate division Kazan bacterium RBG_13_50_9]|uniref:Uncharacterized protein n=1 Tax=candidate division Kazan bacterium RBG_13_50_9 TaxID=1798535 RepID=A0A1F4NS26_UNCK3|nr:MAG: hypothetical protein A2V68_00840 [candidate division Kazan bacterium RBG_13_50_9]
MDKAQKAVLVPIIFFSFFQFPLNLKELRRYLWQYELTPLEIEEVLKRLPQAQRADGLVWWGRFTHDRGLREKLAREFWAKVARRRWIFANVPFLDQAFVSNTLAYDNVHFGSDIDLFLIGKHRRLWTMRAWLVFWLNLFGWRVRGMDRHGRFSPEFFISDYELDIKAIALDRDYYFSYWMADLVPIWPAGEDELFHRHNRWAQKDLPIAWRSPKIRPLVWLKPSYFRRLAEKLLSGRFGEWLEQLLYRLQAKVIDRNLERMGVNPEVITNENIIKLHFNDRRAQVRDAIERDIREVLGED